MPSKGVNLPKSGAGSSRQDFAGGEESTSAENPFMRQPYFLPEQL